MKRSLWTRSLTNDFCPAWPCPTCHEGTLALVPKSLIYKETADSQRAHGHEAWDPEWIKYTFTAWGICSHPYCKQEFAISGVGGVESLFDDETGEQWSSYFQPMCCNPMPNIIELPSKCPDNVKKELQFAFILFWVSGAACAGRVRVSLELVMDFLNVPKLSTNKKGKEYKLDLDGRIKQFAKGESEIAFQLMALKWLGNTGSHAQQIRQEDLLDAFEILEHALVEIIDKRSARVTALAKSLEKKHKS